MSRFQPKKFTPQEERDLEHSERLHARAAILKAGVREALSNAYPGPYDLNVAIEMLGEARECDERAYSLKRPFSINPGKAKR